MTRTNFVSGLGITEADMWRITTNTTIATAGTDLTSNWERADTDGFGYIGTGMSQSSGIFTFPSTGVYLIEFNTAYRQTTNDANYVSSSILTTLDNSSYDAAAATLSASRVNDYNTNTLQFILMYQALQIENVNSEWKHKLLLLLLLEKQLQMLLMYHL